MLRLCGPCLVLAACGGGGGFPDAQGDSAPAPIGRFAVMWNLVDQASQPLTCERVAGSTMTVLAHNLAFGSGEPVVFTCATGMGTSQGLVPGTYEMDFELTSPFGVLARGARQVPVQIDANTTTTLAPVTFQVDARGGIALKVASGQPSGNCGAKPNGAGIDQMSITFTQNSDATCRPITLTISDGATQTGGTYTTSCTTPPATRACIEADQVISATDIPADSYTIRVRGNIATKPCWTNDDTIQVPPLGKTLLRTLNLARAQTGGC